MYSRFTLHRIKSSTEPAVPTKIHSDTNTALTQMYLTLTNTDIAKMYSDSQMQY